MLPRRYTLTHSDATGDLFLTVGTAYDWTALETWQVRAMADEVVAEWVEGPKLVVHVRAQGGWVFFPMKTRVRMFRDYMPMCLEIMRYGDAVWIEANEIDEAPVEAKFHFRGKRRDEREEWGRLGDYKV